MGLSVCHAMLWRWVSAMAAKPAGADALGTTTVVHGPEEFLSERAVSGVRDMVRNVDPEADVRELAAEELGPGSVLEMTSPSLFATTRCVIVRQLEALPPDALEPMVGYLAAPDPDVALVLQQSPGSTATAVVTRLRKAGAREVRAARLTGRDLKEWTAQEIRAAGASAPPDVVDALIDGVGTNVRALASAVSQLVADLGERLTVPLVRRYYGGQVETKGYSVADAALYGRTSLAIERLRWALSTGVDPVLVTSAMASGLRALAVVRGHDAPGVSAAELALAAGVPAWKLGTLRKQSAAWSDRGLAAAIAATAKADADVKGAGVDRMWACERLVIAVLRARALS